MTPHLHPVPAGTVITTDHRDRPVVVEHGVCVQIGRDVWGTPETLDKLREDG
jgi:hypothetical protein